MAEDKNSFDNQLNKFFYDGNTCPSCKTGFTLHNSNSIYYGCTKCHSYIDVSEKGKFKKVSASNKPYSPLLPVGAKAEIKGTSYEVIAFTRCREYKGLYAWSEYYLYNSLRGFAFLSEYDGHWIFLTESPSLNINKNQSLIYDGLEYQPYSRYKRQLIYAEGEFDFDIFSGEFPHVWEYIHPPYMISTEQRGQERHVLKGEYMTPAEMKEAFANSKVKASIPKRKGVGTIQPFAKSYSMKTLWAVTLIALLVLLLGHLLIVNLNGGEQVVFKQTFYIEDSVTNIPPIVTQSFALPENLSNEGNIEIELSAPVEQTWLETQINLVNDETGQEYSLSSGVEFYSGYDDGTWTEGSQTHSIVLSLIPSGKYHLNIFAFRDGFSIVKPAFFTIQLTRNISMKANLFVILLLMLAFPLFEYWQYRRMENARWMNSNLS